MHHHIISGGGLREDRVSFFSLLGRFRILTAMVWYYCFSEEGLDSLSFCLPLLNTTTDLQEHREAPIPDSASRQDIDPPFPGPPLNESAWSIPPVGVFVGVAALFLGLSYGVRLAVRSRAFADARKKLLATVRTDTALGGARQIPPRTFTRWLAMKLRLTGEAGPLFAMCVLAVAVLPPVVALIWTRARIDGGLKTVFTIVLVGLTLLFGVYSVLKHFGSSLKASYGVQAFLAYAGRRRRVVRNPSEGEAEPA